MFFYLAQNDPRESGGGFKGPSGGIPPTNSGKFLPNPPKFPTHRVPMSAMRGFSRSRRPRKAPTPPVKRARPAQRRKSLPGEPGQGQTRPALIGPQPTVPDKLRPTLQASVRHFDPFARRGAFIPPPNSPSIRKDSRQQQQEAREPEEEEEQEHRQQHNGDSEQFQQQQLIFYKPNFAAIERGTHCQMENRNRIRVSNL